MKLKHFGQRLDWGVYAALALALPLIVPFLASGLPATADAEIHFHRIISAAVDIQAGYLWPRWTPYLHQGFGYPIHNFYAPGIHIVGAIVFLLTHIDPTLILKAIQFSATLLYPLGAYCFTRTFASRSGALIAAAAYTFAPFRFNELWSETNLSQFYAMALMPWLLLAIARGAARPTPRRAAQIGLVYAAIVVLHHPTAFLFTPFAGLYALGLVLGKVDRHALRMSLQRAISPLIVTVGGIGLGLALSAIYWLPALLELKDVQITKLQTGTLSVAENFIALRDLVSGIGPVDRTALTLPSFKVIGQPQILVIVLGLLILLPIFRSRQSLKFHVIGGALICGLCIFLITPASGLVWSTLPIASLIVYPWRLLGVIAVGVLPGAAAIPSLLPVRWREPFAGAAIGLFFVAALPLLYAPLNFAPSPAPTEAAANSYEARTGNVGLTSGDEYLPVWAVQRPLGSTSAENSGLAWFVSIDNGRLPQDANVKADVDCGRGTSCFDVNSPAPFDLIFHQMYFPGWQAIVDGQNVQPEPTGPSGLLTVHMPAGENRVTVWYGGTTVQAIGTWLSIAGLLISGVLWVIYPRPVNHRMVSAPIGRWLPARVIAAMVGFVILNQLFIMPDTMLFRRQSDPASPPASHLVHGLFGDTLELLGYDLDSTAAAPGQSVRVTLYWRILKPTNLSFSTAVHLIDLNGHDDWGGAAALNPGSVNTNGWPTDRYVLDTLQFTVAPDAPPYVGELRVSVFQQQGVPTLQYVNDSSGQNSFPLTSFRVEGNTNVPLDLAPQVVTNIGFGNMITLEGYQLYANASGQQCIRLRWQAQTDGTINAVTMLHVLDAQKQTVGIFDAPPLDGLYPTASWLKGQVLDDTHCFDRQPAMTTLLVGLYNQANVTRLAAVAANGDRLPDDGLTIALP